ncbi:MAG TPA: hypothetical protein VLJ80_01130 [Solirubrobacteraceae bacterium]|nr:hypothetical protein [Solirubrobacteraceae bacterium]
MNRISKRARVLVCTAIAALAPALALFALEPASTLAAGNNAAYTTFNPEIEDGGFTGGCVHGSEVNCNTYVSKPDVYVNGGPTGGNGLADGEYVLLQHCPARVVPPAAALRSAPDVRMAPAPAPFTGNHRRERATRVARARRPAPGAHTSREHPRAGTANCPGRRPATHTPKAVTTDPANRLAPAKSTAGREKHRTHRRSNPNRRARPARRNNRPRRMKKRAAMDPANSTAAPACPRPRRAAAEASGPGAAYGNRSAHGSSSIRATLIT